MTEGTLFNPGFLGASFNWWVGQIADDSTWRDNIIPGKFEGKDSPKGWGYRYKVRIIGLHDKEEETVPSDQLPWAQVMYPITGGGGQAGGGAIPNLRQGNFVFGFFLDGQDMQVPVIMGVLGNNVQTGLSTKIGTTGSNFSGTSGFAKGKDPDPNIKAPDHTLSTEKPKSAEQSAECSPPPPGTQTNKYGLRPDKPLSSTQFKDAQSARSEADARGLSGASRDDFVQSKVAEGISNRCEQASSPTSPSQPGATVEDVSAVHLVTVSDVKRQDKYLKKIVLLSPCDLVDSAMKGIKTALENLTNAINKILEASQSYIDAASSIISQLKTIIKNSACEISKYMKIIFDKIFEYILKIINKSLTPTVDLLYPNERNKYLDLKDIITELLKCLYSKITDKLCGQIESALSSGLKTDPKSIEEEKKKLAEEKKQEIPTPGATNAPNTKRRPVKAPQVPVCSVESLVGDLIGANLNDINSTTDSVIGVVNSFLEDVLTQNSVDQSATSSSTTGGSSAAGGAGGGGTDTDTTDAGDSFIDTATGALTNVQDQIGSVSNSISGISSLISGITGSMTAALSFQNISISIFGCDLKPSCPTTDYYTLQNGGGASPNASQPTKGNVANASKNASPIPPPTQPTPFAQPAATQPDVDFGTRDEAVQSVQSGQVTFF